MVSLRGHFESLSLNVHLLTDREGVERTLTAYSVLLTRGMCVCSHNSVHCVTLSSLPFPLLPLLPSLPPSPVEKQQDELTTLVDSVTGWWTDCSNVASKVAEMREDLCDQLPLAGSLPCIKAQDEHIQV